MVKDGSKKVSAKPRVKRPDFQQIQKSIFGERPVYTTGEYHSKYKFRPFPVEQSQLRENLERKAK